MRCLKNWRNIASLMKITEEEWQKGISTGNPKKEITGWGHQPIMNVQGNARSNPTQTQEYHNQNSMRGGHSGRGRGRGRTPSKLQNFDSRDPHFQCIYHGRGHSTKACPETQKNFQRFQDQQRVAQITATQPKLVQHTYWKHQSFPQTQHFIQPHQTAWQPSPQFYPHNSFSTTTTFATNFPPTLNSTKPNSTANLPTNPSHTSIEQAQPIQAKETLPPPQPKF